MCLCRGKLFLIGIHCLCTCLVFMSFFFIFFFFFFSSRRRHTRYWRDWSSDVCSSDLPWRRRPSSGGPPSRAPLPLRSPVFVGFRELPDQRVQHTAEAEQRGEDGEHAVRSHLAIEPLPQQHADQDGDGKLDPEPCVAERSRGWHGAKLSACEKFRKQVAPRATLCGAWEYDVLT